MSQKFKSEVELQALNNATTDTDKFLVSDSGVVKYRTGNEVLSDLGITLNTASKLQHQVKAGVAINKGQAVYVTSADGTNMIVGLASNASEATSSKTMGLLDATVAINGFANVVTEGLLDGLNTVGANAGDPVWLGTGGNLIYGLLNKPYAPAHLVFIGIVTRVNANNGEIFVKVQNGFELNEIHDVDLKTTTPVNGHVLGFDGTLWVNKTIAGWLGYTPWHPGNDGSGSGLDADLLDGYHASAFQLALTNPVTGTGTLNYVSKFTSATTLGNSQIFDNGTSVGVGTSSPSSLLSVAGNATFGQGANRPVTYDSNGGNFRITPNSGGWATGYLFNGSAGTYKGGFGGFGGGDTLSYLWIGDDYNIPTITVMPNQGNVGIGTTSPGEKLVVGNLGGGVKRIYVPGTYNFDGSYLSNYDGNGGGKLELVAHTGVSNSASWRIANNNDTYGQSLTFSYAPNATSYSGLSYSAPAMLIANSGNVGIGTTSPTRKLHVTGGIRTTAFYEISNGSTNIAAIGSEEGIFGAGGNDLTFYNPNATSDVFYTSGSERMRITSGGNVGIGVTNPSSKLHVYSSGEISRLESSTTTMYQTFRANGTNVGYIGNGTGVVGGGSATDFGIQAPNNFVFATGGSSERMRITSSGNVGIGTTSPAQKLSVFGNIYQRTGDVITWNNGDAQIGAVSGYNLAFSTYDGISAMVERLRITSGGNVGIGTTSPVAKLEIVGNTRTSGTNANPSLEVVNTGTSGFPVIQLANTISSTFKFWNIENGRSVNGDLGFFNANGQVVTFKESGRVGIGTTTPSYYLHVANQVSNVSIYANYDIVAYSDQSVKENIRPIENALERVIKSRGVLYDRTDSGEKNNIGFIAQELEVAFPELVVTNEDGTKAVKYQNAVAVLFEAIKEQQKQIDELKQIINGITR